MKPQLTFLLLALLLVSFLLSSCGSKGPRFKEECWPVDDLCYEYQETYYRCEDYSYPYYWYEIYEDGYWIVWYNYGDMYNYYCN